MPRAHFGLPPIPTSARDHVTATVVFEYVWTINDISRETATYTTTYINTPSLHTLYALVHNDHMRPPSQTQVVAMPVTLAPSGGTYTCDEPATIATHSPTSSSSVRSGNGRLARETRLASAVTPLTMAAAKKAESHSDLLPIALLMGLVAFQVVLVWLLMSVERGKRPASSSRRRSSGSSKTEFDA